MILYKRLFGEVIHQLNDKYSFQSWEPSSISHQNSAVNFKTLSLHVNKNIDK